MAIMLVPLREVDVPQALSFIAEAAEWSPRSQATLPPEAILGAPNSLWYSALTSSVVTMDEHELVGIVGYSGISWPDGSADVCLGVVPKWRTKGVAKELAKIQNAYAFRELGLRRLQMVALTDSPSCKIAEAAGLTLEGTLKSCRLKAGSYRDANIYALVREV